MNTSSRIALSFVNPVVVVDHAPSTNCGNRTKKFSIMLTMLLNPKSGRHLLLVIVKIKCTQNYSLMKFRRFFFALSQHGFLFFYIDLNVKWELDKPIVIFCPGPLWDGLVMHSVICIVTIPTIAPGMACLSNSMGWEGSLGICVTVA